MTPVPAGDPPPQAGWPRLRNTLFHLYFLLRRPMTLGVRALVLDGAGSVFLIRHTYVPGWQLPGGGVERGETCREALERELMEEGNIRLAGEPELRSLHFNRGTSRRDHVAFYVVTDFTCEGPKQADREIAEAGFFPLDRLPELTSRATLRRMAEVCDGAAPSPFW